MAEVDGGGTRTGHTFWGRLPLTEWVGAFAAMSVLVGVLCGVFWWRVVVLPTYTIGSDFRATIAERGLTEFFAIDAWFTAVGVAVGAGLGYLAWRWFGDLGWPVVIIASAGSLVAGGACWWIGTLLGPGNFADRLSAANPDDVVPIQFALHIPAALIAWVFGAVVPVLVLAALAPDDEDRVGPGMSWWRQLLHRGGVSGTTTGDSSGDAADEDIFTHRRRSTSAG